MADGLNEACGVMGCVASQWPSVDLDIPYVICEGLLQLQHRGQESAGIVTSQGEAESPLKVHRGRGMVSSVFASSETLRDLQGNLGIGHTRYSTMGGACPSNQQPFVVHSFDGPLAVAHNGELVNARSLRKMVFSKGVGLSTQSDSELITQILCLLPDQDESPDWGYRIRNLMSLSPVSYSLLILHGSSVYGVRDRFGNRPLCVGKITDEDGGLVRGWLVASESCAFQSLGGVYLREVRPGELVEVNRSGVHSLYHDPSAQPAFCIFEYVYFSRADSIHEGQQVWEVRAHCGRQLALEAPVPTDIVSSIPESSNPAAIAFAKEIGVPYTEVFCKNRYVGRTFIQPTQERRVAGIVRKFGVLSANVRGRRIVMVDDSIVRGNTITPLIRLLRQHGAKEVHVRVASPPIRFPCRMGIHIPTRSELIANKVDNIEEMARIVGADSLAYLSVEGLRTAVRQGIRRPSAVPGGAPSPSPGHCTACLTGEYPVEMEW